MTEGLRRWYAHVHSQPCLACRSYSQVEAAHIEGFPSRKVRGQMMPRSHVNEAAFCCIPLCATCHRTGNNSQHTAKESTWLDSHIPGGRAGAIGWIARQLAEVFT